MRNVVALDKCRMQLQANKIKVGKRFRQDLGDLESLKSSIQHQGLLHSVVISEDHELICGYRRLRACQELGLPVSVRVVDIAHWIEAEYDENVERKDFTLDEKVSIMEAIRERVGNRQGQRTDLTTDIKHSPSKASELRSHGDEVDQSPRTGQKTAEFAAKKAGLGSESSAHDIKTVLAKGCPQLIALMNQKVIGARRAAWLCKLSKEEQVPIVEQGKNEIIHRAKLLQIEHEKKRTYKRMGAKHARTVRAEKQRALTSDTDVVEKELQAKFRGFWVRTVSVYAPRIGSQRLLQIFIHYLQTLLTQAKIND